MVTNFKQLWEKHFEWSLGILVKEIRSFETFDLYVGNTPDEWFNFALPKVESPEELDLQEIKTAFSPLKLFPVLYLFEKHINSGFPGFLERNGFNLTGHDTWMVFNHKKAPFFQKNISAQHIGLDKFVDYADLVLKVFKESDYNYDNQPYIDLCRRSLTGEIKSQAPGFSSEFFMVYEDGKPAAGAGLFLTNEVGYLHNDGIYKEYRGKGYHRALIEERVALCLQKKIETLYTIVEQGSQSFRNFSRCGFETWQVANLFTLKNEQAY